MGIKSAIIGIGGGVILCQIAKSLGIGKVFVSNTRVHHYEVGLLCIGVGMTKKIMALVWFGLILVLDDFDDLIKDSQRIFRRLNNIQI